LAVRLLSHGLSRAAGSIVVQDIGRRCLHRFAGHQARRASNRKENSMNSALRLATAFAAGAAIMYYLDPEAGRRRRAMARDKGVGTRRQAADLARTRSKLAADRLQGAAARTRARMSDEPVDDDRLRERIRSKLGHLVEHPGAVNVQVDSGHVVLGGNAAVDEIDRLADAVAAIPGVDGVDNRLAVGARPTASGAEEARH
jgi:hyperosmotically inducible protein